MASDGKMAFLRDYLQVCQASSEMCPSLSWPFFLGVPTLALSCLFNWSILTPIYVDHLFICGSIHVDQSSRTPAFLPLPPLCLVLVTLPALIPSTVTYQHSLGCQITVPPPLLLSSLVLVPQTLPKHPTVFLAMVFGSSPLFLLRWLERSHS